MGRLYIVSTRAGVKSELIARGGGEVVAEQAHEDYVLTLVDWPKSIEDLKGWAPPHATITPAAAGWFADDNGGGALINPDGARWRAFDQKPEERKETR